MSDEEKAMKNTITEARPNREFNIFGCMVEDLRAFAVKYVGEGKLFATKEQALTSILSDAQEEIAAGQVETARKTLNRVKWLINEVK